MEFYDRVPTYPGRVKLVPVPGQANTYDMVRADEPTVEGTPLNKALFESIGDDMEALRKSVSDAIFTVSQRVALSNVAAGTEIGLYENGVLVPFIVLHKSYEGTGRALVIRKSCYKVDSLVDDGENFYADCKTDRWLNTEYLSFLDAATQSVIPSVNIDVSVQGVNGMTSTIQRKAFLLSAKEYALSTPVGWSEGEAISYFDTDSKRVALFQGSPIGHYTRTFSYTTGDDDTAIVTVTGTVAKEVDPVNTLYGIRPAFTLPATFEVTVGVPSPANTMATAEVI